MLVLRSMVGAAIPKLPKVQRDALLAGRAVWLCACLSRAFACTVPAREPLLVVDSSAIVGKYDLIARLDYNMQM